MFVKRALYEKKCIYNSEQKVSVEAKVYFSTNKYTEIGEHALSNI